MQNNGGQLNALSACQDELKAAQNQLQIVQANMADLLDRQRELASNLNQMAADARQKAQTGQPDYWRGVSFGLEEAAAQLRWLNDQVVS